jgi:hypothetical protein
MCTLLSIIFIVKIIILKIFQKQQACARGALQTLVNINRVMLGLRVLHNSVYTAILLPEIGVPIEQIMQLKQQNAFQLFREINYTEFLRRASI